jgi:hypothetical protein
MDQRGALLYIQIKIKPYRVCKKSVSRILSKRNRKKQSQYIQVDLEHIMNNLKPGQTYEIKEAYIGKNQKLFTRVIIYRLTDKQIQERRKNKVTLKVKRVLHFQKRVND